jgi:hypothetical protein
MDYYFTYVALLGLRDSNLPPFRDARVRRYKSVKKMVDLASIAVRLSPKFPVRAFVLDPYDRNNTLTQPSGMTRCPCLLSSTLTTQF